MKGLPVHILIRQNPIGQFCACQGRLPKTSETSFFSPLRRTVAPSTLPSHTGATITCVAVVRAAARAASTARSTSARTSLSVRVVAGRVVRIVLPPHP